MTPEQLFVYTEETFIHAQLALSNYTIFQNIVSDPSARQRREAWMYLQSFLSHFGMVSKLLFAPSARENISKQRAIELQQHLETDTTSALNDRDARNAIEHLDERLDNWLSVSDKGILESVFETRAGFEYLDLSRWAIRRVFLVSEEVFIIQETGGPKEMKLSPILGELNRVSKVCREKLNDNNPYTIIQPQYG